MRSKHVWHYPGSRGPFSNYRNWINRIKAVRSSRDGLLSRIDAPRAIIDYYSCQILMKTKNSRWSPTVKTGLVRYLNHKSHGNEVTYSSDQRFIFSSARCASLSRLRRSKFAGSRLRRSKNKTSGTRVVWHMTGIFFEEFRHKFKR